MRTTGTSWAWLYCYPLGMRCAEGGGSVKSGLGRGSEAAVSLISSLDAPC